MNNQLQTDWDWERGDIDLSMLDAENIEIVGDYSVLKNEMAVPEDHNTKTENLEQGLNNTDCFLESAMKVDEGKVQDSINDTQFVILNNVLMSDFTNQMNYYNSKNMKIVEYEHQEDAGPSYQQQQEGVASNSSTVTFKVQPRGRGRGRGKRGGGRGRRGRGKMNEQKIIELDIKKTDLIR